VHLDRAPYRSVQRGAATDGAVADDIYTTVGQSCSAKPARHVTRFCDKNGARRKDGTLLNFRAVDQTGPAADANNVGRICHTWPGVCPGSPNPLKNNVADIMPTR